MKLVPKKELIEIEKRCELSLVNIPYTSGTIVLDADVILRVVKELRKRRFQMSQLGGKQNG